MNKQIDENLAKTFLVKFGSKEQLRDWTFNFIGLDFPVGWVDPDSNSSPIDWMWSVYQMYEKNECNKAPSVIIISSRESYKTLTQAVMSVILMVHFHATIAHLAAIVPQAQAAQRYIASFLRKIAPYLEHHHMELNSQNAKEVSIKNPDGSVSLMKIIVCTLTGANSSHTNILNCDEIDTIRSGEGRHAYKEAQLIPGVFNGQFPLTVKTSTLKFSGGLFQKEIDLAHTHKWPVWKWNIIDITEYCPPERHQPKGKKEIRYIGKRLPLANLTQDQYDLLMDKEKENYDKVKAMAGCATCPLLPVCRSRLANRPKTDVGGLYKPIDFTIQQFQKTDPDMAEAQLMTWKVSTQGLVYGRFLEKEDGTGNTYTLSQAFEVFTGSKAPASISLKDLILTLQNRGIRFYVGGDFGSTHAFALVVSCVLPNGEWWLVDSYSVPQLEFDQMMDLAMQVRDIYKPIKYHMDTAQPMFIKAFNKNRMPCANFKKDVQGGIGCVRTQIINAKGKRSLKVIKHERNELLLTMFREHSFKLDTLGNVTQDPDDSEVADIGDSLRYSGQNLFAPKGKLIAPSAIPLDMQENANFMLAYKNNVYTDWMTQKVRSLASDEASATGKSASGGLIYSFGGDEGDE